MRVPTEEAVMTRQTPVDSEGADGFERILLYRVLECGIKKQLKPLFSYYYVKKECFLRENAGNANQKPGRNKEGCRR